MDKTDMSNKLDTVRVTMTDKCGEGKQVFVMLWKKHDDFIGISSDFMRALREHGITSDTHPDKMFTVEQWFPPLYGKTEVKVFVPKGRKGMMIGFGVRFIDVVKPVVVKRRRRPNVVSDPVKRVIKRTRPTRVT